MAALGAKAGGQNEVGCCWVADVTSVLFTTLCQEKVSVGCWHGGQSLPRSNREAGFRWLGNSGAVAKHGGPTKGDRQFKGYPNGDVSFREGAFV